MLKTFAAATAALVFAAGSASAADLYVPGGYKDAPVYPIWAGYYFGVNVGGAYGHADISDVTTDIKFHNDDSAFLGGGQFGFLYQRGPLVVGPEVDLGGIGLSHTSTEPGGAVTTTLSSGFSADITGRLGFAYGPALIYFKGGYAYYGGDLTFNDGTVYKASGFNGFTIGGGLEYSFNPAWSAKVEYQHFDFENLGANTPAGNTYNTNFYIDTVKFGLNYHIGPAFAPLK